MKFANEDKKRKRRKNLILILILSENLVKLNN